MILLCLLIAVSSSFAAEKAGTNSLLQSGQVANMKPRGRNGPAEQCWEHRKVDFYVSTRHKSSNLSKIWDSKKHSPIEPHRHPVLSYGMKSHTD